MTSEPFHFQAFIYRSDVTVENAKRSKEKLHRNITPFQRINSDES